MQYIFTERAHLMCPNMCFGIVILVDHPYDEPSIRDTVAKLSAAHPFLNALLGHQKEKNAYYYRVTDMSRVELKLMDSEIADVSDPKIMDEYRLLVGREWDLFREGMLKVVAWRQGQNTCFLIVLHHLLADGRGALGLAEELAECYSFGTEPKAASERLISSVKDFPADSRMPFLSRTLVDRANKAWEKERHTVSYEEYAAFANEFLRRDVIGHSLSRISAEKLGKIQQKCHEKRVTVNDYLIAKMMIDENTRKVIIASDLRSRLDFYQDGALGNYSTAFSVEIKRPRSVTGSGRDEIYALAKSVHEHVKKTMNSPQDLYLVLRCYADLDPGLLDAAFISCRGGFPSKAGRFIGSMFFGFEAGDGHSITNLGRIESKCIKSAYFIPPASPAIRKTQGILTVNGDMYVCTSERSKVEHRSIRYGIR